MVERVIRASQARTGDHLVVAGERRLIVAAYRAGDDIELHHPRSVSTVSATAVVRVHRLSRVADLDRPEVVWTC